MSSFETKSTVKIALPEFRPACFHTLMRLLGETDAGSEWGEVAIRELIRAHDEGGDTATNEAARRHGIRVHDMQAHLLRAHWARLQVIATAHYLEFFLDSFRRELKRDVRSRTDKEDLVTYTLAVYQVKKVDIGELQVDLLDYYRTMRNQFVHDPAADDPKRQSGQAEVLRARVKEDLLYSRLDAPNSPSKVSFDDFVIFTRAVKDFAKSLCALAQPSNEEIAKIARSNKKLILRLKADSRDERRAGLLENYIKQTFGYHATAGALARAMLADGLLA